MSDDVKAAGAELFWALLDFRESVSRNALVRCANFCTRGHPRPCENTDYIVYTESVPFVWDNPAIDIFIWNYHELRGTPEKRRQAPSEAGASGGYCGAANQRRAPNVRHVLAGFRRRGWCRVACGSPRRHPFARSRGSCGASPGLKLRAVWRWRKRCPACGYEAEQVSAGFSRKAGQLQPCAPPPRECCRFGRQLPGP